jgi:hypothetical protein
VILEHCIARSAHTSSLWRRGDWMGLHLDSKRQAEKKVVHHRGSNQDHLQRVFAVLMCFWSVWVARYVGAPNVLPRNSTQMRQKTVGSTFSTADLHNPCYTVSSCLHSGRKPEIRKCENVRGQFQTHDVRPAGHRPETSRFDIFLGIIRNDMVVRTLYFHGNCLNLPSGSCS